MLYLQLQNLQNLSLSLNQYMVFILEQDYYFSLLIYHRHERLHYLVNSTMYLYLNLHLDAKL